MLGLAPMTRRLSKATRQRSMRSFCVKDATGSHLIWGSSAGVVSVLVVVNCTREASQPLRYDGIGRPCRNPESAVAAYLKNEKKKNDNVLRDCYPKGKGHN